MNVFINNLKVELFHGAQVKHALLKADPRLFHLVAEGKAEVRDQEGHLVDLNGTVSKDWNYSVTSMLFQDE